MNTASTGRFYALGTDNCITACGDGCSRPLALAEARIREIEQRMSAFRPGSDVWELNDKAGRAPVRLHEDTFGLLRRAAEFSWRSGGAFDITVRPLVSLWGVGKKKSFVPSGREIGDLLPLVGYRGIKLDKKTLTAFLPKEGQAVDLGGIAKGYAADEARRILLENGVESALINLGGNIVTVGCRPSGELWKIGIQNPLSVTGEYLAVIPAGDCAVVTSGSNERFFLRDGIRYHHILDPRTGWPAQSGLLSVTAVCGSSADADALTTALFVLGREQGMELIEGFGAEAVFLSENLELTATDGLARSIEMKRGCIAG